MRFLVLAVFASIGLLAACDDTTNFFAEPLLYTDTVEIAAPGSALGLPSALDVTISAGGVVGGRFPERQEDAEQWDVALRVRNGALVFLPAPALGLRSRAAITRALPNETYATLIEAPGRSAFVTDSAVLVQQGSVYAVRSRDDQGGISACPQYAKIQPLTVDVAQQRVRLQVTTNQRCSDPRLAVED